MSGPIGFSVLGPLQAGRDGRSVELGPARRRATLAALLVDVGRVVAVDTLVERVWDGRAPSNPVTAVHAYVSRLRSALRDADRPDAHVLVTAAPGYRLDVGSGLVDAVVFERAVTDADKALLSGDLATAQRSVRTATELWRGEPYADIAAEFARVEATRLRGLWSRAEEIGIEVDLAQGRHALLVERLRAMVAAEPLREPLQGALMLALYRSGRQAEALAAYQAVRTSLADELGADPSRALQVLHEQLLRQDPALDLVDRPVVSAVSAPERQASVAGGTRTERASSPRLVGRKAELDRVYAVIEQGWAGPHTAVAAVVGEAGIGKTRLLDELATTAPPDVVVVWGRSWEHEGSPPLWPWVQILREVVEGVGPEIAAAALAGRGAAVLALDPDLVPAGDTMVVRTPQESIERSEVRLFDGIVAFLGEIAAHRRLLLLVEDVHWADPASRRFTEYLVTNVARPGIATVVTLRSQADDGGPLGSELLAVLARTGRTSRIDLGGLAAPAVREYVADRTGTELDDATADALAERTGGNPFFVEEIVRLLVIDGENEVDAAPVVGDEVPESVRGVILRRVQRLPADDQAVLRTAAVVGRTFDLDLLRDASGLDEDVVDEAVDRATATGMLASEPGNPGQHRFFHALVQQTLLEDIGPVRRRRLHGRVAAALLARSGTDSVRDADWVVHHLAAAGGEEDLVRAGEICIAAADAAYRRGNYSAAVALLTTAIELAGRLTGDRADRAEMAARTRLSSLYMLSYHASYPSFLAQQQRMITLVRRLGTSADLTAGLQVAYGAALFRCDFGEASALAAEMLARGAADGDDLMVLAGEFARGMVAIETGRPDDAIEMLGRARDLVRGRSEPVPIGVLPTPAEAIGSWRVAAYALAGRWDEAAADLADLPELMLTADPAAVAHVHGDLAVAHSVRDDVEAALRDGREAVRVSVDVGIGAVEAYIAIVVEWARCRVEGGLGTMRDLVDFLPEQEFLLLRPHHFGLYADLLLRTGDDADLAEADRRLTSALAESAADGNAVWDAELHRLRARAWERLGRPSADVVAERDRAVEVARAQGARAFLARAEADRHPG